MSLNKERSNLKMKSKILRISLPRSNPNIKADIDAELDNGWYLSTTTYLQADNDLLFVFTRPARR